MNDGDGDLHKLQAFFLFCLHFPKKNVGQLQYPTTPTSLPTLTANGAVNNSDPLGVCPNLQFCIDPSTFTICLRQQRS